ncbi:MAG: hypothetical protein LBH85_08210 [Treponema sp.]|jgi:hypothetical protein|nr:hypothetical protein [Treponema sp.]
MDKESILTVMFRRPFHGVPVSALFAQKREFLPQWVHFISKIPFPQEGFATACANTFRPLPVEEEEARRWPHGIDRSPAIFWIIRRGRGNATRHAKNLGFSCRSLRLSHRFIAGKPR